MHQLGIRQERGKGVGDDKRARGCFRILQSSAVTHVKRQEGESSFSAFQADRERKGRVRGNLQNDSIVEQRAHHVGRLEHAVVEHQLDELCHNQNQLKVTSFEIFPYHECLLVEQNFKARTLDILIRRRNSHSKQFVLSQRALLEIFFMIIERAESRGWNMERKKIVKAEKKVMTEFHV